MRRVIFVLLILAVIPLNETHSILVHQEILIKACKSQVFQYNEKQFQFHYVERRDLLHSYEAIEIPTDVPSEKRYKTSQRLAIVEFLSKHCGESFAVDDVYDALKRDDEKVGRTTVYRTLEKLCKEQSCTKIDARAGKPAQYIYGVEDISNTSSSTHDIKLYCMNCNKLIALNCHHFQDFEDHVFKKHGFSLVTGRSLIYGTCEACIGTEDPNSTKRKD